MKYPEKARRTGDECGVAVGNVAGLGRQLASLRALLASLPSESVAVSSTVGGVASAETSTEADEVR